MKIITRAQFMAMPEGTIYAEHDTDGAYHARWCAKGATIHDDAGGPIDWFFTPLCQMECERGGPVALDSERDGTFHNEQLYAVLEAVDLTQFVAVFSGALAAAVQFESKA